MSGETVLGVSGIAKSWLGGSGLAPTTFRVAAGQFVAIRGRSGTGKSTILSIIAGWCEPDAGTVSWANGFAPAAWTGVAVVPQTLALVPELSIAENVELPLRAGRFRTGTSRDRRVRSQRVGEMLAEFDLVAQAGRLPRETSMGQQQRAALARAFVASSAIVLIDEPTSHQDHDHGTAIIRMLAGQVAQGTALVVATHDPHVLAAADLIVDLDNDFVAPLNTEAPGSPTVAQ